MDFSPCPWSDHEYTSIDYLTPEKTERGDGYWKFNATLLEDANYREFFENFWRNYKLEKANFEDARI